MPPGQFKNAAHVKRWMKSTLAKRQKKLNKGEKKQVAKIARKLSETKYTQSSSGITTVYANVANNTGAYWQDMTATISPGTDDFAKRIGDKINISQIKLNYTVFMPAGANAYPSAVVRIMVVQYLRNDNAPASSEIFRTNSTIGGPYLSSYSYRNRDYMRFYHILYDKRVLVQGNTTAAVTQPPNYRVDKSVVIPLRKIQKTIQYVAAGTVSDNGIWFFAIGDQPHVVGGDPNVAMNYQILYKDS